MRVNLNISNMYQQSIEHWNLEILNFRGKSEIFHLLGGGGGGKFLRGGCPLGHPFSV